MKLNKLSICKYAINLSDLRSWRLVIDIDTLLAILKSSRPNGKMFHGRLDTIHFLNKAQHFALVNNNSDYKIFNDLFIF